MHAQVTEWWNSISLRTKITGVTVLLVTLGLLVAGVGTMSFLRNYLYDGVNQKIVSVAADPASAQDIACKGSTLLPDTYMFIAVIDTAGEVVCENNPVGAAKPVISSSTLPHTISAGQPFELNDKNHTTEWRVIGVPAADSQTAVLVGVDLAETNSTIGRFAVIFLFFSLIVVILGGFLTRALVTSTFAPLREVEDTAARFAAGDFSQRLERGPRNTEVGRLNESLNLMLSRIDASFADRIKTIEQMRRFVGDASHELRTPLVSVRGYAELYRMGALGSTEEVAQAMERIEKEAIRMSELVGDLLELARIDEAKPLNLTAVDLVPLANDAAMDAMASAPSRHVSVVVTLPAEPVLPPPALDIEPAIVTTRTGTIATRSTAFAGATLNLLRRRRPPRALPEIVASPVAAPQTPKSGAIVLAEENKIRQVITNLMGNALRFTPDGSPIEIGITVDRATDSAYLSVIDHGEGIPPQIREKIFQRFWRADSSRNRDTGGSGLGLAIVASIVASHKGTVEAVETPGGGSTFRVRLPLLPEAAAQDTVPTPA
jgi:two-component system OmpR family sensor kinase